MSYFLYIFSLGRRAKDDSPYPILLRSHFWLAVA